MPLPSFLLLIALVISVAALTLWVAFWAGVPFAVLGGLALAGAAIVHLSLRVQRAD